MILIGLLLSLAFWLTPAHAAYQGFGAHVTGGAGQAEVSVTNCNATGAGSLREAIAGSASNRHIRFTADCRTGGAGPIPISGLKITASGTNVTIDGMDSPSGYIEVREQSLNFCGSNMIVRGIRHLGLAHVANPESFSGIDGFQFMCGAPPNGIVLYRTSARHATDETISITSHGALNLSLFYNHWSDPILPQHDTNMLIGGTPTACPRNISGFRNLLSLAERRNPWITCGVNVPVAPSVQVDWRNNVGWDISSSGIGGSGHGMHAYERSQVNLVNNYLKPFEGLDVHGQRRAILICKTMASGTHTGSTQTNVLIDATKNFTALGIQPGWYVWNMTDNSHSCQITSVGTTTVTCSGLQGGSVREFRNGHHYKISRTNEEWGRCRTQLDIHDGYIAGNQHHHPAHTAHINSKTTRATPLDAPDVSTVDACWAAWDVVNNAGVLPRDTHEQAIIDDMQTKLVQQGCYPRRYANPGGM